jgi:hypothetical protein
MIVIPMAGASRRFTEAGYGRPKFELLLDGRCVFDHAVGGFAALFASEPFLFIVRDAEAAAFVHARAAELGVARAQVVSLGAPTAGQAETVSLGLAAAGAAAGTPLTIFNIDTFRPGYRPPTGSLASMDGWLEVFRGAGANWSYVRPAPGDAPIALETAEKRPISDLCCTGLYHFTRAADFEAALAAERAAPSMNELYVAPLYNHLIKRGGRIGYRLIERGEVVFCGTPEEYQGLGGEPPGETDGRW